VSDHDHAEQFRQAMEEAPADTVVSAVGSMLVTSIAPACQCGCERPQGIMMTIPTGSVLIASEGQLRFTIEYLRGLGRKLGWEA